MNLESLKQKAAGQWAEIIARVASIPIDVLDGRHHVCPSGKCSSTKDSFRFTDMEGCGSAICSQSECGKFGDGFATIQWLTGDDFKTSAAKVAEYLGETFDGKTKTKKSKTFLKPIDNLLIQKADGVRESFCRDFCKAKPGIEFDTLWRCRWAPARWPIGGTAEFQSKVLAFVTYRLPTLDEHSYILYRRDGKRFSDKAGERKAHILGGSATGNKDGMFIAGTVEEFREARICYKCEGITDAIALASILDSGEIAIANICGADSVGWMDSESFEHFDEVVIVADNDPSGVGLAGASKFAGALL